MRDSFFTDSYGKRYVMRHGTLYRLGGPKLRKKQRIAARRAAQRRAA